MSTDKESRNRRMSRKSTVTPLDDRRKTVQDYVEEVRANMTKENAKRYCKSFSHFMFSTVGLCLLVVLYSLAGGFLFSETEIHSEVKTLKKIQKLSRENQKSVLGKMGTTCLEVDFLKNDSRWKYEMRKLLQDMQVKTYDITSNGWDGTFPGEAVKPSWELVNAVLFAVTIITTIGYGHIAPKTPIGQMCCVAYAIVGVPIALLYLTNIGSFMADVVRYTYHYCCCEKCYQQRYTRTKDSQESLQDLTPEPSDLSLAEDDSQTDVDYEPGGTHGAMKSQNNSNPNANNSNVEDSAVPFSEMPRDHDDDEDIEHEVMSFTELQELDWKTKYRHMSVPVSLTVLIMITYLFIGAVIFSLWEDWTFIQAFYFSFITLTTIGLGDLVPGLTDTDNAFKPVLCAAYVLMGMALIAMCMDLMQAEVKARAVKLAVKVGIVKQEEEKQKKTDAEAVFAAIQG